MRGSLTYQLLVGDPNLDGLAIWTVLHVEVLDHRDVLRSPRVSTSAIVRVRSPVQSDGIRRVLVTQLSFSQKRLQLVWQLKVLIFIVPITKHLVLVRNKRGVCFLDNSLRNRVNQRVKVECWQVRIIRFDVDVLWLMIFPNMHRSRQRVVQVRESDLVL